jgi:transcriptional regulator with XRE-family HTH domain
VATNVRRLREERGWTTAELAKRLSVGSHVVRDYERPRKGSAQRQFLWSEIVTLCAVFGATIFELTLPPDGYRSVPEGWENLRFVIPRVVEAEGSDEMKAHWRQDDRGRLMEVLFGATFKPEHIDTFIAKKEARIEHLKKELKTLFMSEGEEE